MNHNLTVRKHEVTKKSFRITPIMGVVSGIVLEDGGWVDMQEVMNHFFPGIMTMGAVVMSPVAKEAILEQHPFLASVPLPTPATYKQWVQEEMSKLPAYLDLEGPLKVDETRRKKLAEEFLKEVRR